MSGRLISRSSDLQRLQDEGYEVEIRSGFLLLHSVPHVTSRREVAMGTLVTDLTLNNDQTQQPGDHQVWFVGEHPCNRDGSVLSAIGARTATQVLCEGLEVHHRFSCKPPGGHYLDYYAKMTQYVEIVSNPARPRSISERTHIQAHRHPEDSVFIYTDSASSRADCVWRRNSP